MTAKLPLVASTLALVLAAAACGEDEMPRNSGRPTTRDQIECTATIGPVLLDYEVAGDTLTLSAGLDQLVLDRIDDGTGVFGIWDMGTDVAGGELNLRVTGSMHIEADRVSSVAFCQSSIGDITAVATSAAIIDDTTIEILESDSDTKRLTR